jgi:Mechanosensitive ion channel, conserved TM helix
MHYFISLILEPLKEMSAKFLHFAPNLLAMLIIILVGIIAAKIVRLVLLRLLKAINFDAWSDRMGLTAAMRKGEVWAKPSAAVGAFAFWLLVIVAIMAGLGALQAQPIDNLISQFVLYLPRVISAALIVVFGYIATSFIGRAILISAVNRGFHFSKLLAEALRLLLVVLFVAMALEQLQVAPGIVVAAFSILFGGIVFALAIAFGVGGIEAAKKIIEHETAKKAEEKRDIEHI